MANFEAWDHKVEERNSDFIKLQDELCTIAKDFGPIDTNVEILWRLCKVSFLSTLNLVKLNEIKAKTRESYEYGEKAVKLAENNFDANLWLANAAGKLSLLESDMKEKCYVLGTFLNNLTKCSNKNPNHPLVMFMEGRLQLAMLVLTEEEKNLIKENASQLSLPPLNTDLAETKIRKSIELNPSYIDGYITLAYLLVKMNKMVEALEVIEKGLTLPRITKSDELVARDMEKLKASLGKK